MTPITPRRYHLVTEPATSSGISAGSGRSQAPSTSLIAPTRQTDGYARCGWGARDGEPDENSRRAAALSWSAA